MKKVYLIIFIFLSSLYLGSQEVAQEENLNPQYVYNKFWDNWFFNFGGGGSMYFGGKQHKEANFFERLTWGATLNVGKWFSPIIGARLTFQGGKKHVYNVDGIPVYDKDGNPIDLNTLDPSKIHHRSRGHYLTVHADALFNLSNLFYGYKDDRFYNLISYAGAGIGTDRNAIDNNSPVIVLGLLNTFRINEKLAISFEVSAQAVQSKFNDAKYKRKWVKSYKKQDWDEIGSVNLGLIIGLGCKQKFEKVNCDEVPLNNIDQDLLSQLSEKVDSLTQENKNLQKNYDEAKKYSPKTIYKKQTIVKNNPYPVQFDINSSSINSKQEAIIYNIAEFLKENESYNVEIIGFADKKTGSKKYNEVLSLKRSKAIENKLINEYGISPERIFSSGKGDSIQPYPKNDWNRVVIITVIDSN
ncbi:OmpA family protein [uncultured Apibacter sp.]|uniref:OmpA family protein n=1 Tax=uncultured Apibacter sp. TaxID=1778616 RepID=UPI0025D175E5|nr:OmpA family protein [uncultured Apibacter sp.]